MAFVRVEQRNAHLASSVRLDYVNGRDGKVAKGTMTVISNARRGSGEERAEEATVIQWTLWGKQAENAAEYLGKGSHVNVVGRLRNNNFKNAEGVDVYGFGFTCEELDYLDSKAQSDARRARQEGEPAQASNAPHAEQPTPRARRTAGASERRAAAN